MPEQPRPDDASDATTPEATTPETTDRDTAEPDTAEPEATDRDTAEPDAAEPDTTDQDDADQDDADRDTTDQDDADRDTTDQDGAARPVPAVSRTRRRIAAVVGLIGELLITGGVVLALFVVYSLWWTNIIANEEARRDSNALHERWESTPDDGDDVTEARTYDPEDGIGFLHVPAMTDDVILVKEGVDSDVLNGGVAGYYDDPVESAMPWDDEGNFSLAAHRDGHGAKFHNIHEIQEGDAIVFETRNSWYVYRAFAVLPETSKYNTGVLAPIPEESGRDEPGNYITLTTCTPILSSAHRYVVWGELERVDPVDAQRTPPPELRP